MISDERVVQRWTGTGLLDRVSTKNLVKAARRLDEAAARALAGEADAIEKEIVAMRSEGMFAA